jgi:hypothetical protein
MPIPKGYPLAMLRMVVGHSSEVDASDAIEEVLAFCERDLGGSIPRAGLLFATHAADHAVIVSRIRERYPDVQLIGSSSAGEMSSVLGYQEDSITLALFTSDSIDFTVGLGTDLGEDPQAAVRAAVGNARAGTDQEPRLCIATPSVGSVDPAILLGLLQGELGSGVPILGGGSAAATNEAPFSESFQFCNDDITGDGVPILLLSGPLVYSFGVDTGWKPIGPKARVTRASVDAVQEIDDRPALEFYERYLGSGISPAFANPLAVFEQDSASFYLRAPTRHDAATGSIGFAGGVPEGATVQLTIAATDEIFEGTAAAVSKAIQGYPKGSTPEAALVFSCAIRKFLLGTRTGTELEMIRERLGRTIPVSGFYCFGEIAPVRTAGPARYHNETIVAVVLGSAGT